MTTYTTTGNSHAHVELTITSIRRQNGCRYS